MQESIGLVYSVKMLRWLGPFGVVLPEVTADFSGSSVVGIILALQAKS